MHRIYISYKDMWLKAINFKGRSTNEEYWWPFLINVIISIICMYVFRNEMLALLYNILIVVPFISLSVRRIHDGNRSGWNILWLYIPTVVLCIYAGAILYYTQRPEIVDMFLKWFTAMVVAYVVMFIYSVYLLTIHTFPKKNHYGEVPHVHKDIESDEQPNISLEVPQGKNIEDTLTFKTKAFIEKAKSRKKQNIQPSDTVPLSVENETKVVKEPIVVTKPKVKETKVEAVKPIEAPKTRVKIQKTPQPIATEPRLAEKKGITQDTHITSSVKKEDIIVRAQLKPTKKPPIKKPIPAMVVEENKPSKPTTNKETVSINLKDDKNMINMSSKKERKANYIPSDKTKNSNSKIVEPKVETKNVRRPIKRKPIQPIEIPDLNVEKIHTHSLDSIAKIVEKNMTKDPKDAPTVVATIKRRPVKRQKKENE